MAKMEFTAFSDIPDGSDILTCLGCYFRKNWSSPDGTMHNPRYNHKIVIEISDEQEKETDNPQS